MAEAVYVLSALTSLVCAWLLLRTFAETRVRLLLWSGLCFVGLALNNVILFFDKIVVQEVDLSTVRLLPAFVGVCVLLFGLIWETDR